MVISKKAWINYSGAEGERWEHLYGTTLSGNLPQHKEYLHVGNKSAPCPYSTQANALRTRLLLGLSDSDPLPTQVNHTTEDGKVHYMSTSGRGSKWGFECTFDNCPYYISNQIRYFYV